jgi:hypothetical protein
VESRQDGWKRRRGRQQWVFKVDGDCIGEVRKWSVWEPDRNTGHEGSGLTKIEGMKFIVVSTGHDRWQSRLCQTIALDFDIKRWHSSQCQLI